MKKPRKSEKLLLEQIARSARTLLHDQRGMEIGKLVALIRAQLIMSQRALARRAGVPQSTISKIEAGRLQPNVSTLKKILGALECDLLLSAVPRMILDEVRQRQAIAKAERRVEYLKGTMSLEGQTPDEGLLREMIEEEAKKLLESSGSELWGEGL